MVCKLAGLNGNTIFFLLSFFDIACTVKCSAKTNAKGELTVRVYTTLNSAANDESFTIDNVVVQKLPPFMSETVNFNKQRQRLPRLELRQDHELWLAWQRLWWLQHQGQGARHQEDV